MIEEINGNKMMGTSCTSCDSKDEVSEYRVGDESATVGFRLCKKCKSEFVIILRKKSIQELKEVLYGM